jgi:hypothetical protein
MLKKHMVIKEQVECFMFPSFNIHLPILRIRIHGLAEA